MWYLVSELAGLLILDLEAGSAVIWVVVKIIFYGRLGAGQILVIELVLRFEMAKFLVL